MGLDVYLYRDIKPNDPPIPDDGDRYEEWIERFERVEIDSAKHPDHTFKIGYMRSSYNDAGTNSVLAANGLPDLYQLFGCPEDEYEFLPDFAASRERLIAATEKLREIAAGDPLFVTASGMSLSDVPTAAEALGITRAEIERHKARKDDFGSHGYSNRVGNFWPGEPLRVAAIIPCGNRLYGNWIVARGEAGMLDYYVQALEIAAEMCDWALAAQAAGEKLAMRWSG